MPMIRHDDVCPEINAFLLRGEDKGAADDVPQLWSQDWLLWLQGFGNEEGGGFAGEPVEA